MNDKDRNVVLLVLGLVLIGVGLWWLLGGLLGPLLAPVASALRVVRSIAWPLVFIGGGILFIVMAQRGHAAPDLRGRRLYRSRSDRVIAGVIGGFAEYVGADATLLRVGYALLTLALGVGPGVVLYVIAIFIVPEGPPVEQDAGSVLQDSAVSSGSRSVDAQADAGPSAPETPYAPPADGADERPTIPPAPPPTANAGSPVADRPQPPSGDQPEQSQGENGPGS